MNLFSLDLGLGFGFGLGLGLGKRVRGKWGWGWGWGLKIYPWTEMEMKIIPANGGGPGMDGVFLSGYGDGDYTPRPRSGPLPSLLETWGWACRYSSRIMHLLECVWLPLHVHLGGE